jgi:hypothetical protein
MLAREQAAVLRDLPEPLYPTRISSCQDTVLGYPALSEEAIGWLAYMHRKTGLEGIWTKDGRPHEAWDNISGAPITNQYRYDLTYATFALALMADITPAWREVYSPILSFLADHMVEYWSFADWVEEKGPDPQRLDYPEFIYKHAMPEGYAGRYSKPGWVANGLGPYGYNPDPVYGNGVANIMYKGYFNLILGLYEYVSGDAKYDDVFKIVYDDSLSFEYDHKRIVDTLAKQWVANPIGIACEVRKIFLWCNNLSGLSVRLYDLLHGTSWFWTYQQCHNTMKQHHLSGPQGGPVESVSLYHDPDINYYLNRPDHQMATNWFSVCWLGYPFDPETYERVYEGAKKHFLVRRPDGSAYMSAVPGTGIEDLASTCKAIACAREFGDEETYAALRKWADARCQPVYDPVRGEFYLTFGFSEPYPRGQYNDWSMAGYVSNGPRSWYRLFNQPNLRKFQEPTLTGVEFPLVRVRQAHYDPALRTLNLALCTVEATALGQETTFTVMNLAPGAHYRVIMDGQEYKGWQLHEGTLQVHTTVGTHSFIIQQHGA